MLVLSTFGGHSLWGCGCEVARFGMLSHQNAASQDIDMKILAKILIGIIAVLHIYICWFEMFAWTTRGPVVFSTMPPELFEPTTAMAANQGIYNLFLALGLIWSLLITDKSWWKRVALCFLMFVAIAGIVGAVTVSTRILMVQTVPAVIAILLVYFSREKSKV